MKIERTKNASRNVVFGTIRKAYQLIVPFFMRTVIVYLLGPGYAGLNNLFTSVLQVLNLAELGVGSAMTFSMYKPIAEDDKDKICALMKLYRLYYRVIGIVVGIIGLSLLPFIPSLIKSDLPENVNVYVLYLMNLAATVLTYWLFSYRNCILTAHQRIDVPHRIALVTDTIKYIVQVFVLFAFHDYYLYVLAILFTQVINNCTTAFMSAKLYPQYSPKGNLAKDEVRFINGRIRDLFTSKLGGVILNSSDSIVVSAFLGLNMLTIYQNYYFIVSAIMGFVTIIFTSISAGIANSLVTETLDKNFNDMKKLCFMISWISGFCCACFLAIMQPFMEIWMGKELMQDIMFVVFFCMYFYILEIMTVINVYKDSAGLWHEDRFRPLASAFANLLMNVIMVQFWGLYGVILSTVLAVILVSMPWLLNNLFSLLFTREQLKVFLKKNAKYLCIVVVVLAFNTFICSFVNLGLWGTVIIRLAICIIVPNVLFYLIYRRTDEFKQSVILVDKMTKGRLHLSKVLGC
ncbi:MAG: polysaccharide biosynthesis protein [Butyrivibrio sp.]|nr:polysaccharide biosynthesis protein [Butyrivibrio sp.]